MKCRVQNHAPHPANPASASTLRRAAPESIDTTPSAIASRKVSAFPAATRAAAALVAAGTAETLLEGMALGVVSIDSGAARRKVEALAGLEG